MDSRKIRLLAILLSLCILTHGYQILKDDKDDDEEDDDDEKCNFFSERKDN